MSDDPVDDLRATFQRMREQTAQCQMLAKEILRPPSIPAPDPRIAILPPPPPPPPPVPPLTKEEVVAGWSSSGDAWVSGLSRRYLQGAVTLLGAEVDGRTLLAREGLASALLNASKTLLTRLRYIDALASVWFLSYPPPPWLTERLARVIDDVEPAMLPRWLRSFGPNPTAAQRGVAPVVRMLGHAAARGELALPSSILEGGWVDEIVRTQPPSSVDDVQRLLELADRGKALRAPAGVTDAVRRLAQGAVSFGRSNPDVRRRLVTLLRARIGELFGEVNRPRWTGLEPELRTLRGWVAGEFMDVIFQHVHPDSMLAHQLAARRTFWRGYGGAVDSLTVYVKDRSQLMSHPDVARIVNELEGMVRIGTLDSPTRGHAILVMEMTGITGAVTVVEGNSSASVRIRAGKVSLPHRELAYSADITNKDIGAFRSGLAFVRMHDQAGNWMWLVRKELARYGVSEVAP